MAHRDGYSGLQIALHWIIALLVIGAYTTSDGMEDALRDRIASGATGIEGNTTHVWFGGAVFALVLIRIAVRLISGAPGHTPETPPRMALAATWGHRALYALMVLVPLGGAMTWYLGIDAGEVHEIFGNLFMALVLGHAVMAIVHEAWLGDGTFARMLRPGGTRAS